MPSMYFIIRLDLAAEQGLMPSMYFIIRLDLAAEHGLMPSMYFIIRLDLAAETRLNAINVFYHSIRSGRINKAECHQCILSFDLISPQKHGLMPSMYFIIRLDLAAETRLNAINVFYHSIRSGRRNKA